MLTVEQNNNLLNLIEATVKVCKNKQSLSEFLLNIGDRFPYQKKKIIDFLISGSEELQSSIRFERATCIANLRIPPEYRIIVAQVISNNPNITDVIQMNKLIAEAGVQYQFNTDPTTIAIIQKMIPKIVVLSQMLYFAIAVEKLNQINEIRPFINKYLTYDREKLKQIINYLDQVYDSAMENILDLDKVKEKCIEVLRRFGHLANIYGDKGIEELLTIIFHERKAAEAALMIRSQGQNQTNEQYSESQIIDKIAFNLVKAEI